MWFWLHCLHHPPQSSWDSASTNTFRRFAIWLLHKHFEPIAGEVFVEPVFDGPRRTETAPAQRPKFSAHGLSATAIRFDGAVDSGVGVIGMEFAEPADFGSISPLVQTPVTLAYGSAGGAGGAGGGVCGCAPQGPGSTLLEQKTPPILVPVGWQYCTMQSA